jgi:hypothetical protein
MAISMLFLLCAVVKAYGAQGVAHRASRIWRLAAGGWRLAAGSALGQGAPPRGRSSIAGELEAPSITLQGCRGRDSAPFINVVQ